MTIYGYARVSTKSQSIDRQVANILRAYPDLDTKNLFCESFTGRTTDRPEFQRLLKRVQAGDTLALDSVSRFSRNAEEGFTLYEDLYKKGVNLVFLKEPYINTQIYRKALSVTLPEVSNECLRPMMEGIEKTLILLAKEQFKQAFEQAEKEVKDLRQRTREGMKAKGAGEKIGAAHRGMTYNVKKREKAFELIRKHSKTFGGSLSDPEVMALIGCGRRAYYQYKKALKED